MNSLPYEGVRVLVLGSGPRVGKARQLLSEGGATIVSNFSSQVTYVVVDRTVPHSAPQVVAARRAAIPVVTTSELQTWPGMEGLAAVRYLTPARLPVSGPVMTATPVPVYTAPLPRPRGSSGPDTTLMALSWAAFPLLTGGLAMPFITAHVARKLRSRTHAMLAAGYGGALVVSMLGFIAGVGLDVDIFILVSMFTWLCCWLGGSVHAFLMYESVSRDGGSDGEPRVSDPRNAQALAAIEHRRNLRDEARQLAKRDPVAARELGIGRPDRHSSYDDGGLIDVNNAPASILKTLPGVTDEVAQEIIRFRELTGPFESTSDVVVHTSFEPRYVDRFDELALYVA
ncbi:helix-hairpin-helix domain-containing protein [Stackebrandtia nassauensis]|uniref:BRCT domain-containing protein n=1 Tax=Stackebrandtia nassauensis (strain DSM 44728 / CIP 108903 / NRRL B-16338 / NBRC 102104 / LLR-40K-21) TaxID=446470 RepID=D3Q6S1_STANL|nr:helix-hairpin-helix domain-containing protein [Stackebrandtia nassauensis]ADD40320.1 hypothetical protein Snas_0606 [Stackebrandtia nassauensis DSM 44728]